MMHSTELRGPLSVETLSLKSVGKALVVGRTACRNVRDLNFEFERSIHCEIFRIFEKFDNVLRDGFYSRVSARNAARITRRTVARCHASKMRIVGELWREYTAVIGDIKKRLTLANTLRSSGCV
jgi:hypothetical protein